MTRGSSLLRGLTHPRSDGKINISIHAVGDVVGDEAMGSCAVSMLLREWVRMYKRVSL